MWLFCGGIFQTAMLSLFKLVVFCIFCISIQILKFEFMKLIPITREIVPSWTCTGYLYHTFQPVSQDFHSQLYFIFWFVLVLPLCCSVLSPFTLGHFICTFLQVSATEHGIEHSISLLLLLLFFFPIASLPWSTIFPIFPPSYSVCATSHNGSRTGLHVYSLLIFFFPAKTLCSCLGLFQPGKPTSFRASLQFWHLPLPGKVFPSMPFLCCRTGELCPSQSCCGKHHCWCFIMGSFCSHPSAYSVFAAAASK